MSNRTELEQLDYDDALLAFFHVCQQYGARRVLEDFRAQFPEMHREIVVQLNRTPPEKVAALLRDAGPV
jgi:hypothetical protein